jgi:hypothetical protein
MSTSDRLRRAREWGKAIGVEITELDPEDGGFYLTTVARGFVERHYGRVERCHAVDLDELEEDLWRLEVRTTVAKADWNHQ